jgi:hypothetical protein
MRNFVIMLVVVFAAAAQANLILNADFGSGTLGQLNNGGAIDNWNIFGTSQNGWYQTDIDSQRSVTMWWDDVGIFQNWACTPGEEYLLTVDARQPSVEPLVGWHAYLKVEWYDNLWAKVGESQLDYLSSADPQDAWIQLSGLATAAAGSANGRIVLGLNNWDSPSGKAYFDNASVVAAIPEPSLAALVAVGLGVVRLLRKRS